MQSTEGCWMVVHLYSKYGNAEKFADIFLLFLTVLFFNMKYFANFSTY